MGRDTRRIVHRCPEQVVLVADDLAGVQAYADGKRGPRRVGASPPLHAPLDVDGTLDRPASTGERQHLSVAKALYLDAPVALDLAGDDPLHLAGERPGALVAEAVRELGRLNEIREHDGD